MSAPTDRWLALGGRWLRRAPATLAGLTLDAVVDSLGLGRRALAWIAQAVNARTIAVATLVVVIIGGAALWRYRRAAIAAPETLTRHSTSCASCRCRTDTDRCVPPSSRGGPAAL
jgi:hypothetical protein